MNLKTMRDDNYNFSNDFQLKCLADCKLHALALFFEIGYTKCHKHVFLSTRPDLFPTRWKQIVFHLEKHVSCFHSDKVFGQLVMKEDLRDNVPKIHFVVKIKEVNATREYLYRQQQEKKKLEKCKNKVCHRRVVRRC